MQKAIEKYYFFINLNTNTHFTIFIRSHKLQSNDSYDTRYSTCRTSAPIGEKNVERKAKQSKAFEYLVVNHKAMASE